MASVNKAILLGRLGQDPELRYTQSGTPVCKFSIATGDKNKDGEEKTEWHNITVWDKQAENCAKYLAKGRQVFIEGRLHTNSWDDQQGVKRYSTSIVAQRVQFIGGEPGSKPPLPDENQMPADEPAPMPDNISDIPF